MKDKKRITKDQKRILLDVIEACSGHEPSWTRGLLMRALMECCDKQNETGVFNKALDDAAWLFRAADLGQIDGVEKDVDIDILQNY